MMRHGPLAIAAALLFLGAGAGALEVGERAPDFTLAASDGTTVRLADFVGKRGFVLAWFPKAFTPGCTRELETLRDGNADLARYDASVFMVSMDPPEKNAEFAKSLDARLVLLSDPDGAVARQWGVSAPGALFAKRWTFYVDAQGVVRDIDKSVSTDTAAADIARKLGELGFPRRD